jgi:hypothetical protein
LRSGIPALEALSTEGIVGYRVFLSHSGHDADWVKHIAQNANAIGIETYLFEHDVQPGRLLSEKIKQAIDGADAMVVLLTEHSRFSPYVQQEIGYAEAKRKLVIPLVQPSLGRPTLAMLDGKEYLPFDFQDPTPGLAALLNYLAGLRRQKEHQQGALLVFGVITLLALGNSGKSG